MTDTQKLLWNFAKIFSGIIAIGSSFILVDYILPELPFWIHLVTIYLTVVILNTLFFISYIVGQVSKILFLGDVE